MYRNFVYFFFNSMHLDNDCLMKVELLFTYMAMETARCRWFFRTFAKFSMTNKGSLWLQKVLYGVSLILIIIIIII